MVVPSLEVTVSTGCLLSRLQNGQDPPCPAQAVDAPGADEEGTPMLGDHPIHPVLLAKDLAAAREFYHDKLGLEILMEDDDAIGCAAAAAPSWT
jgi:hypothetical protein